MAGLGLDIRGGEDPVLAVRCGGPDVMLDFRCGVPFAFACEGDMCVLISQNVFIE